MYALYICTYMCMYAYICVCTYSHDHLNENVRIVTQRSMSDTLFTRRKHTLGLTMKSVDLYEP